MKLGIRTQLIAAFTLVVLLPVAVTLTMLSVVSEKMDNEPGFEHLAQPDAFFERITRELQEVFYLATQHEVVMMTAEEYFARFAGSLQIIDVEGRVLFDSQTPTVFELNVTVPYKGFFGLDTAYNEVHPEYLRYVKPIIVDTTLRGSAVFTFEEKAVMDAGISRVMFFVFLSLVAGFLCLVGLMVALTMWISRSILLPLKELNVATERISQGDLSFKVRYAANNELGTFCRAFSSMQEQLKGALDKQKETEQAKKQLIASISHDLRTPITSIKGYVEALRDGKAKDEDAFRRYLRVIENKTASLDRLIDDLAMFSQLEMDRMLMSYNTINSESMLDSVVSGQELVLRGSICTLSIKRPFPAVIVKVDESRIAQVIDNLFENAQKYSVGECVVELDAIVHGGFLRVCVRDNGPGIAVEHLPYIFDAFYRGDKSRSRDHGGTGLGLAICKFIVEEHGGRIWAESPRPSGTVVCFEIPVVDGVPGS